MTKPLAFTQAGLKRAMLAAREAGLRVRGVRPDGVLILDDGAEPLPPLYEAARQPSEWEDKP